MDYQEIMHYWYYFCSICEQLETTRQYIDHRVIERDGLVEFENGSAYSNAFLQILVLAASEFETVSKLLCREIEPSFDEKSNILKITETILTHFPKIGQTLVTSDFLEINPLDQWHIGKNEKGEPHVDGLDWWDGYNSIKHKRYEFFKEANLKNCVLAVSSLLVLELYLSMQVLGNVSELSTRRCPYFHFKYGHMLFWTRCPDNLPDFPEKK